MSWHVDVYSIKMLLLTIGMWYEGGRTGSTQGWLFSQAFDWCCEEPSPRTGGMASHSMFHMVLSANLSERLSLQIGRFASHQQCHPNTSCWEQEALWGGCASGFGLQILISFRTPVKHFLLSLGLKIMRKGRVSGRILTQYNPCSDARMQPHIWISLFLSWVFDWVKQSLGKNNCIFSVTFDNVCLLA